MTNAALAQRLRKYMNEGWESLPQLKRDVLAAADALDPLAKDTWHRSIGAPEPGDGPASLLDLGGS